jgi:hypothetical protein
MVVDNVPSKGGSAPGLGEILPWIEAIRLSDIYVHRGLLVVLGGYPTGLCDWASWTGLI